MNEKDALLQSLPSILKHDPVMGPLGETVAEALSRLWKNADLPAIYARIDALPEELLDILAKDFKVDWYDYNHPIETKRAVLRDSFYVHRHLGTVGAVRRALSDVFPAYTLEEWFQYGGEPYHFRVSLLAEDFDAEKRAQAIRYINMVKPARAWLDDIYVQTAIPIAIEVTSSFVDAGWLMPSDDQLTGANDIADWEEPSDVARVGTAVTDVDVCV